MIDKIGCRSKSPENDRQGTCGEAAARA